MTELDPLFPPEVTVTVADEAFTLKAFTAKNLRPYLQASRRMQDKASALGREVATAFVRMQAYNEERATNPAAPYPDLGDIPAFLVDTPEMTADSLPLELLHERCYEEYVTLVSAATGKPVEWVENIGIDELVTLAGIVNKLNQDRYLPKKPSALTAPATVQS